MAINGLPLYNPWNAFSENAVEGDTAEVGLLSVYITQEPTTRGREQVSTWRAYCLLGWQPMESALYNPWNAFSENAVEGDTAEVGLTSIWRGSKASIGQAPVSDVRGTSYV